MRPVAIIIAVGLLQATLAHADEFSDQIDLRPLATLEVQHLQTLKTLDSFARQTMYAIRGRSAGLDGNSALYSILDMSFRPERFDDRNIIKIRNVPLRMDLQRANISDSEKQRLLHDGLVSPRFLSADATRTLLIGLQSSSMAKADAVGQLMHASGTFDQLARPDMPLLRVIPPATDRRDDSVWHNLEEIAGNSATFTAAVKSRGSPAPPALPNFQGKSDEIDRAWNAILGLRLAWRDRDSASANRHIAELARVLPQINPQRYPSQAKRSVEVIYNRLAMLTIPGAALYLAALVCFLMSARAGVSSLRLWGLRVIALAWLVHLLGIAVRWWLVSTSVGNWFESIPIKNQFESVLMSAFFGVSVGLALELWRGRGIFGAAASFVGCLSLLAIFAAPYVFGREIGGPIGQVNGVLMSSWLYIHVTMVTASYALISMSFCLSAWW
ncbi:MAG: hypothetical protein ACREJC_14980, partial [Tepidisphaeraceae bacterium]